MYHIFMVIIFQLHLWFETLWSPTSWTIPLSFERSNGSSTEPRPHIAGNCKWNWPLIATRTQSWKRKIDGVSKIAKNKNYSLHHFATSLTKGRLPNGFCILRIPSLPSGGHEVNSQPAHQIPWDDFHNLGCWTHWRRASHHHAPRATNLLHLWSEHDGNVMISCRGTQPWLPLDPKQQDMTWQTRSRIRYWGHNQKGRQRAHHHP